MTTNPMPENGPPIIDPPAGTALAELLDSNLPGEHECGYDHRRMIDHAVWAYRHDTDRQASAKSGLELEQQPTALRDVIARALWARSDLDREENPDQFGKDGHRAFWYGQADAALSVVQAHIAAEVGRARAEGVAVEYEHGYRITGEPLTPGWDGVEHPGMGRATEAWARHRAAESAAAGTPAVPVRREVRRGPWTELPAEDAAGGEQRG